MDPYPDRRWSNLQWNNNNNKNNNNDDDDHNDNNDDDDDDDNTFDLLQKGEDRQTVEPVNGSTSKQKVEQSPVEQQ